MSDGDVVPRVRVLAPEGGRVMTKQSMALESDVNHIIKRFVQFGQMPPSTGRQPLYGDFSSGLDFHSAMNKVREAERQFQALPAHIRDACGNDPAKFVDMCLDPERREELVELGLVEAQMPERAILVKLEQEAELEKEVDGDQPS